MIGLVDQPFDPGALLSAFATGRQDIGAVASFTGIARAEGGATTALELEAYPGFTEGRIAEMVETARTRFDLTDVQVLHRIGVIAPGEAIVFVAAAARHRRAALDACDYLMDHLKSRAPFWKKEHGPAGARWIEPRPQDLTDLARWEKESDR
jgi:molybdopterin synthase catalytic subunit